MKKGPGKVAGFALKHLLKKPATIAYPKGELEIDPHYRGRLTYNGEDCIGCQLCVRDCPASAIQIINVGTKEDKKFECQLNLGHCIFCGQCVDSCRKGCLAMSTNVELANFSRDALKIKL